MPVKVEIEGQVVEFDTKPSPEDIDFVANKMGIRAPIAQQVAGPPSGFADAFRPDPGRRALKSEQVRREIRAREGLISPDNPLTREQIKQQPGISALRAFGKPFEVTEGIVADVALAAQSGDFSRLPKNIQETILGSRVPQMGDIYRSSGIPAIDNEVVSSTAGFIASMPTAGVAAKPITMGLRPGFQLANVVSKFGTRKVGQVISAMTGLPEKTVQTALSNPEFLSSRFVRNAKKTADKLYKKVVAPLIDDKKATVDLSDLQKPGKELDQLNLYTSFGEETANLTSMSQAGRKLMRELMKTANKIKVSFNEVNAKIAKIDNKLSGFWQGFAEGTEQITRGDVRNLTLIRAAFNRMRKEQYPKAGAAIDKQAVAKTAEGVLNNFSKWRPHLMNALAASTTASVLGGVAGLGFGPSAKLGAGFLLGTIPQVQRGLIRAGAGTARNVRQAAPAIVGTGTRQIGQQG